MATHIVSNCSSLNVRKGPGTTYAIVRSLLSGSEVTVISTQGSWSKIGNNEWVSSGYLTLKGAKAVNKQYTITASSLYARSGPGTNYSKVSSYFKGDKVTVIESISNWGRVGTNKWVCMDYLSDAAVTTTPAASTTSKSSTTTNYTYPDAINKDSAHQIKPSYTPTKDLENRPIYLKQSDTRWKSVMYSNHNDKSQTIGSSGCGPSAASMIINEWIDGAYSPVECCSAALSAGYRSYNNGTAWAFFKYLAVKYGLKFSQTANGSTAKKFMDDNPGALVVCIMSKGNWTTGGHYILMYKCDGTYVYINDPASTSAGRQKNTFALLQSQCRQYFCFANPKVATDAATWTGKKEEAIKTQVMVVAVDSLICRKQPTTSNGDNSVGVFESGVLVSASKKSGDWFYVTGDSATGAKITGWVPANCVEVATADNVNSSIASDTKDAIDTLVKLKFIDSPNYWKANCFQISYMTNLIIKITQCIQKKGRKKAVKEITDITQAINVLVANGVVDSPNYWMQNYKTVSFTDTLICRAASWIV